MKIKNLGILALVFAILLSTLSFPAVFAAENTESATFAKADFSTYQNPTTTGYPSVNDCTYGNDVGFGANKWYMYYTSAGEYASATGSTVGGWGGSEGAWTSADASLRIKAHGGNNANITGIYRTFETPISASVDKTYYFDFVAAMYGNGANTANQIRLGIINSESWVAQNNSYEVDVFGGLIKNDTDGKYYAQVSLDGGTTTVTGTTAYEVGKKYHFLMRLDIDADGNDTLRMKIFADGQAEPSAWDVTATGDLSGSFSKLSMDAYDTGAVIFAYAVDVESYDTEVLNAVQTQIDSAFENFKFSEADALAETIKTLPIGNVRTAYEAKLAALKDANNTFFAKESFNYAPNGDSDSNWDASYNYATAITTLSANSEVVDGWSANFGWSQNYYDQTAGNTNVRFQYYPDASDTTLLIKNNRTAFRTFANTISYGTDGEYYFVFDVDTGTTSAFLKTIDSRIILGNANDYVGMKWSNDGMYAQLCLAGDTTIGCKKYSTSDGVVHRFIIKLETSSNGTTTVKTKVFPVGTPEPAQWELVKTVNKATTGSIGYIGFQGIGASVNFEVHDIWVEKYLNDNLAASRALAEGIANGTVTTASEITEAITAGYAQNEYLAALNCDNAPILGSDISYDASTKTASLKLHNSHSTAAEAQAIIALYNGDNLVGATVGTKVSLGANTRDNAVSVAYTGEDVTYESVKVFIWNNIEDLTPLLGVWTFTVTQ